MTVNLITIYTRCLKKPDPYEQYDVTSTVYNVYYFIFGREKSRLAVSQHHWYIPACNLTIRIVWRLGICPIPRLGNYIAPELIHFRGALRWENGKEREEMSFTPTFKHLPRSNVSNLFTYLKCYFRTREVRRWRSRRD